MAANAITTGRLQFLLATTPVIKPPLIISIFHHSVSSSCYGLRPLRKFSTITTTTPFCSHSNQIPEGYSSTTGSIIGDLLDYLNESWTPFHATADAKRQLIAAGFDLLNENEEWDLKPGGRYFFTRNMSSLVAFAVGEKTFKPRRRLELVENERVCTTWMLAILITE